jgi:hypothetical protein
LEIIGALTIIELGLNQKMMITIIVYVKNDFSGIEQSVLLLELYEKSDVKKLSESMLR